LAQLETKTGKAKGVRLKVDKELGEYQNVEKTKDTESIF
jgi:hypothetical protein